MATLDRSLASRPAGVVVDAILDVLNLLHYWIYGSIIHVAPEDHIYIKSVVYIVYNWTGPGQHSTRAMFSFKKFQDSSSH